MNTEHPLSSWCDGMALGGFELIMSGQGGILENNDIIYSFETNPQQLCGKCIFGVMNEIRRAIRSLIYQPNNYLIHQANNYLREEIIIASAKLLAV